MAVQTFKISDLAAAVANPDTDHVEISRDNGNGTFSSFKAPAGGGGGVAVGQALLQIANQPLDPDYLRLDGSTHPKASYPDIAPFFPTASDWGLGGAEDTTASVGTVSGDFPFALSNDGQKIYVSKDGTGTIEVYNTSTWTLTNTIQINNGWTTTFLPEHMRISNDGKRLILGVYTNSESTSEVSIINTQTESVVVHIPDSASFYFGVDNPGYLYHYYSFNLQGTKALYTSRSNNNEINVFDIETQTVILSFTVNGTALSHCFKYDNDNIIASYYDSAVSSQIIQIFNEQGQTVVGPTSFVNNNVNVFPTIKNSDYFYITGNNNIYKISTTDLSTVDSYAVSGYCYLSESGTGLYLAVGSNDSSKGYFFVLNSDLFTMVSGFPGSTVQSKRTHIAKNDSKLAFGFDSSPYFKVVNQLGSLDDFIIDDLTQDAPNLTFEYRIKAK